MLLQKGEEAHKETQERRRLEDELREQRGLIDALTAETMTLREEVAALQVGRSHHHGLTRVCWSDSNYAGKLCVCSSQVRLQQQTAELEQKLDTLVLVTGGLGLLEAHSDPQQDCGAAGSYCLFVCL